MLRQRPSEYESSFMCTVRRKWQLCSAVMIYTSCSNMAAMMVFDICYSAGPPLPRSTHRAAPSSPNTTSPSVDRCHDGGTSSSRRPVTTDVT